MNKITVALSTRAFSLSSALVVAISAGALGACSRAQPGPDKTVAGAVLGAGWGAGAGAIVGNQVATSPARAIWTGAGFGTAAGGLMGMSQDQIEETQLEQEQALASLKIQNMANARQLENIQRELDSAFTSQTLAGVYQVFFDGDATSMRAGAVANLETIAETLRKSPAAAVINVVGHSDDDGTPEYNSRLAEARARSVSAYLASRGISSDQIKVRSFGSERPIASNETPVGRQLNRRVDIYISR
jgi:outer membrane protein OmpA-like peptidoglycan-associated protein